MTHDDLIRIERTATRAINAIKPFADDLTKRDLQSALYLLAEIRFAGEWLCDGKTATDEERKAIAERLASLYQEELK